MLVKNDRRGEVVSQKYVYRTIVAGSNPVWGAKREPNKLFGSLLFCMQGIVLKHIGFS